MRTSCRVGVQVGLVACSLDASGQACKHLPSPRAPLCAVHKQHPVQISRWGVHRRNVSARFMSLYLPIDTTFHPGCVAALPIEGSKTSDGGRFAICADHVDLELRVMLPHCAGIRVGDARRHHHGVSTAVG